MSVKVKHRHSVSRRFTFAMTGVVTIIVAGFAVALSIQRIQTYEAELRTRLSIASEVARMSLPTPLWYYNYEFLEDFLQALLLDQTLVCASIRAQDELVAQQCQPDTPQTDWAAFTQAPEFLTHTAEIHYEGKPLGVIQLVASRASLRREIFATITISATLALFLILAIALTSILVTRQYIVRPLERLIQIATLISNGEFTERLMALSRTEALHDELGLLIRSFQRMILYLQQMATVATQISTGDLQHEVAPRTSNDILGLAFQRMVAYLNQIGQAAAKISGGDLRNHIEVRSPKDLIGASFAHMTRGLIALITDLRNGFGQIAGISALIFQAASKNADALERIGKSAQETSTAAQHVNTRSEEIRRNAETLNTAVEETSAFITETLASMTQVATHSNSLAHFADDMTATMAQILDALERISVQAEQSRSLSKTARQDALSGQESVEHVIASMTTIAAVTEQIFGIIARLKNSSGEINTVLDVINEIAGQTALLALNASIIAAQSGAHGKSFAVVAEEIKNLAHRVKASTKEIAQIVTDVQRESAEAVQAIQHGQAEVRTGVMIAHQAGAALSAIGQSADNAATVATDIAGFVKRQTTTHAGMTATIRNVASMITQITRAIQEQERQTARLATIVENIRGLETHVLEATREQQQDSQRVTTLMQEIIALVTEHRHTVHEFTALANDLVVQADVFKEHVERFTLPTP